MTRPIPPAGARRRRRGASALAACGSDNSRPSARRHGERRRPTTTRHQAATRRRGRVDGGRHPRRQRRHRRGHPDEERCAANKAPGRSPTCRSFDFAAVGVDPRRRRGQGQGLLRRHVPRRRAQARLLDDELPARGRRPGPVLLGRQLHRDPQVLDGGAKFVAIVDYGKIADRGARSCKRLGTITTLARPEGQDDRREGRHPALDRGHAGQAGLQRGKDYKEVLLDGSTRWPSCSETSTPCPSTSRTSRASSTRPA